MIRFDHFNFNVLDLEKSIAFYEAALGLTVQRTIDAQDGSFKIVYVGNQESHFLLELTWMRDRKEPYNLGECEYHLAFRTDEYDSYFARHKEMGCICYENPAMGIYFITDPDGYWLEIIPPKG